MSKLRELMWFVYLVGATCTLLHELHECRSSDERRSCYESAGNDPATCLRLVP